MDSIDFSTFGTHVLFVAAFVWALVEAAKRALPALTDGNEQAVAAVVAVVVSMLAWHAGFLTGNWFELGAQVVLATLLSFGLHEHLFKAGDSGSAA